MADRLVADVAVVGAGPAGIAAAVTASESGSGVVLVDESEAPGGQIWRPGVKGPAGRSRRWVERLQRPGIERIHEAAVVDVDSGPLLIVERRGVRLEIMAERVVLATGARELFLPFPGWTLPGVVGIGAAQALVKGGLSIRNVPTIIAGTGPLVLPAAASVAAAGACLDIVAEQIAAKELMRFAMALWRYPHKWVEAARYRLRFLGCSYLTGHWVLSAHGDGRLQEVELTDGRRKWSQHCELLCCSYGLVPNLELPTLLGCRIEDESVIVDETQQTSIEGIYCAGEPTGIGGVELALCEGRIAGLAAAGTTPIPAGLLASRSRLDRFAQLLRSTFALRAELGERLTPSTTICRCEDVSWGQIDPEWDFRQAKLYTRLGMGCCQSRVCGPAMRHLCDWDSGSVRPPVKSCSLQTLTV
ncbi:MAG: FAD/NAD(P)-binding oxidoreductase [Acidobacteriota bacterium]